MRGNNRHKAIIMRGKLGYIIFYVVLDEMTRDGLIKETFKDEKICVDCTSNTIPTAVL